MKRRLVIQAGGAAAAACALPALAQSWPGRPVQMICAFGPGSGVDFAARLIGERLTSVLGQQFVVSNRPGAAGTIAAAAVASAQPDGYTFLVNSASHTLYPALYPDAKLDAPRDTVAVAAICEVELLLVTSPSKGWKTLQDFITAAKSAPNPVTFATAGHGSSTHIAFERLANAAGIKRLHVPMKGTPESVSEVVSGRVDVCYAVMSSGLQLVNSGHLVPLAIGGKHRSDALKQVPTTLEAGIPESDFTSWIGIIAPRGTPQPIIDRINREVVTALNTPEIAARLRKTGQVPTPMTVAQFDAQLRSEYTSNVALVKAAGVKAQ